MSVLGFFFLFDNIFVLYLTAELQAQLENSVDNSLKKEQKMREEIKNTKRFSILNWQILFNLFMRKKMINYIIFFIKFITDFHHMKCVLQHCHIHTYTYKIIIQYLILWFLRARFAHSKYQVHLHFMMMMMDDVKWDYWQNINRYFCVCVQKSSHV